MAYRGPNFELCPSEDSENNPGMLLIEKKTSFIHHCKFRQTRGFFCNVLLHLLKVLIAKRSSTSHPQTFENVHNHQGAKP